MKGLLTIIFIFPVIFLLQAQKTNFNWARQSGGTHPVDARSLSVATDDLGNVYSAGYFTGKVDFDPGPGVYELQPSGIEGAFISKLDSAGIFQWAKQIESADNAPYSKSKSVTVDAGGNVVVTGSFSQGDVFGISGNCFVSKLNLTGDILWTKLLGFRSEGSCARLDVAGNIYVGGLFAGESDFDPGPGVLVLSAFSAAFFVCKLEADGNFEWAKKISGGNAGVSGDVSVAIDGNENVYITGSFWDVQDFDPGPGVYNLSGAGIRGLLDAFILKLDRNGGFVWAKQIGGEERDIGVTIVADGPGNIYMIGNFVGRVDFDPGPGSHTLTSPGSYSYTVITKLDLNGNFLWAKQLAGGIHWTYSGVLDNNGNLYSTGYFGSTVDFDPGNGVFNLSTPGYDVFIFKLDASGNFVWAKQIGGSGTIISNSIAVDTTGNVFTSGYFFNGQIDFDPGPGSHYLSAGAGENMFVYKMGQCRRGTSSFITGSACTNYTLNGQTYTTSGRYTQYLDNSAGCDSIITLELSINERHKVVNVTTCDSYTMNNHTFHVSGTYLDTLTATNGCDSIVTLNLAIVPPFVTTISKSICAGDSFNGYTVAGIYTDTLVTINGCDSIVKLQLAVSSGPSPLLGADTTLCAGDSLRLYPGQFASYRWQDGSTDDHLTINKPGVYSVVVTDSCGSGNDEIIITGQLVCDIYFPKAFTPNNDGLNDIFRILGANNITEFRLLVYNRWGQKVFESSDYSKGWNGRFKGQLQQAQTYIWTCEYRIRGNSQRISQKGMVTLIR